MTDRLQNKVAIVFGAGSIGLGRDNGKASAALFAARDGIRMNAIMPGLMNTPFIFQQISGQYADVDAMVAARDAACPTGKMGTA